MVKANIGDVVRFDYTNGKSKRKNVVGRIMSIRDLEVEPLTMKTVYTNYSLSRSRYLLTITLADGTIRSFYNGVMRKARKLTLAERSLLWVSGVNFPKFARV